jgi:mono/diheme cytochrome c family protein
MRSLLLALLVPVLAGGCVTCTGVAAQEDACTGEVLEGKAEARILKGFRRYHAGCNHCHGPDGTGSAVAPSLVDRLPDIEAFQRIVREGVSKEKAVMKGFADDPNVAPYIGDIYAYLRARAGGSLGRGRPVGAKR